MAATQSDEFYVQELISVNKLIQKFFDIFQLKKEKVKTLSPTLSELQRDFEPNYLKYSEIKRFAIPFIGRISSGKSTFLGFLTGLYDILETDTKITTKIVFIIRHNSLAENPKAYNVILEKRNLPNEKDDNSIPKFNFEKGEELKGNLKQIIEQKNNYIKNTKPELLKNEDFFMIIETKIPLINGQLVKYSKIFEFMDLPGLNEYRRNDNDNFKKYILPCICFNVKFSFFIFDYLNLKDRDSYKIYEDYIELLKLESENNFYILNKIDYSPNDPKIELNNFKQMLSKELNVQINKNNFLATNSILLTKEANKYINFNSYLLYKEEELKNKKIKMNSNFVNFLKKEIEKDLSIQPIKLDEVKYNESKNEEGEIKAFLVDLNNKLEDKGFGITLDIDHYYKIRTVFDEKNKNKGEINFEIIEQLRNYLLNSFKSSIESLLNLKNFKDELEKLIQKIKLHNSQNDINKIFEEIKKQSNFVYSLNKMKKLKDIISKLEQLEPNNELIKKIITEHDDLLLFLEQHSKIRISVLGLYSSGKSTILNYIIGKDILPTSYDECTKRSVIIRYHEKDEPELYKTIFKKK